jgi:hypothetical protein
VKMIVPYLWTFSSRARFCNIHFLPTCMMLNSMKLVIVMLKNVSIFYFIQHYRYWVTGNENLTGVIESQRNAPFQVGMAGVVILLLWTFVLNLILNICLTSCKMAVTVWCIVYNFKIYMSHVCDSESKTFL